MRPFMLRSGLVGLTVQSFLLGAVTAMPTYAQDHVVTGDETISSDGAEWANLTLQQGTLTSRGELSVTKSVRFEGGTLKLIADNPDTSDFAGLWSDGPVTVDRGTLILTGHWLRHDGVAPSSLLAYTQMPSLTVEHAFEMQIGASAPQSMQGSYVKTPSLYVQVGQMTLQPDATLTVRVGYGGAFYWTDNESVNIDSDTIGVTQPSMALYNHGVFALDKKFELTPQMHFVVGSNALQTSIKRSQQADGAHFVLGDGGVLYVDQSQADASHAVVFDIQKGAKVHFEADSVIVIGNATSAPDTIISGDLSQVTGVENVTLRWGNQEGHLMWTDSDALKPQFEAIQYDGVMKSALHAVETALESGQMLPSFWQRMIYGQSAKSAQLNAELSARLGTLGLTHTLAMDTVLGQASQIADRLAMRQQYRLRYEDTLAQRIDQQQNDLALSDTALLDDQAFLAQQAKTSPERLQALLRLKQDLQALKSPRLYQPLPIEVSVSHTHMRAQSDVGALGTVPTVANVVNVALALTGGRDNYALGIVGQYSGIDYDPQYSAAAQWGDGSLTQCMLWGSRAFRWGLGWLQASYVTTTEALHSAGSGAPFETRDAQSAFYVLGLGTEYSAFTHQALSLSWSTMAHGFYVKNDDYEVLEDGRALWQVDEKSQSFGVLSTGVTAHWHHQWFDESKMQAWLPGSVTLKAQVLGHVVVGEATRQWLVTASDVQSARAQLSMPDDGRYRASVALSGQLNAKDKSLALEGFWTSTNHQVHTSTVQCRLTWVY